MNNNIFSITDFLDTNIANKFHNEIYNIPSDWWYVAINPTSQTTRMRVFKDDMDLQNSIDYHICSTYAKNHFDNNYFAYKFHREIDNHYSNCDCGMCELRRYFTTDEVKQKLSDIVGEKVVSFNETFISKYVKDDYLGIHHDKKNGDYAFIYQLTKDWPIAHGGLLHFCTNGDNIYKTSCPTFNSITIFKITDEIETDHFVSHVCGPKARIAYTGWFSTEKNEN